MAEGWQQAIRSNRAERDLWWYTEPDTKGVHRCTKEKIQEIFKNLLTSGST